MIPSLPRLLVVSCGSLLYAGSSVLAQGAGSNLKLTSPVAASADAFTLISSVRELSDGRVIVTDLLDKSVQLVDLAAGTATQIGREGQGPGEYGFPGELLPLSGDTTLLVDRINRRFLVILPNGKTGQSIAFPSELGSGLSDPRGIDRNGRIYFQGSFLGGGGITPGARTPDSIPVIRWDRKRGVIDTVTHIKVPALNMNVGGAGGTGRTVMMRAQPFSPQDEWAIAGDGRLGVARVADYHVDWFSPTKQRIAGPANRFDPIRVTEADKEAIRKQNARAPRMVMSYGGGARTAAAPPPPVGSLPEPEYPEFKPAFPTRSVFATPEGMLWVLRSRPATDQVPTLDVFDQRGVQVGKITLPAGRRVVGFGNGTVYLSRTDSDDLQWLEKYRR